MTICYDEAMRITRIQDIHNILKRYPFLNHLNLDRRLIESGRLDLDELKSYRERGVRLVLWTLNQVTKDFAAAFDAIISDEPIRLSQTQEFVTDTFWSHRGRLYAEIDQDNQVSSLIRALKRQDLAGIECDLMTTWKMGDGSPDSALFLNHDFCDQSGVDWRDRYQECPKLETFFQEIAIHQIDHVKTINLEIKGFDDQSTASIQSLIKRVQDLSTDIQPKILMSTGQSHVLDARLGIEDPFDWGVVLHYESA